MNDMQKDVDALTFRETRVFTPRADLERFIGGSIWKDIMNEIRVLDAQVVNAYVTAPDIETVKDLNGMRKAFKLVSEIPAKLVEGLKLAEEEEDKKQS